MIRFAQSIRDRAGNVIGSASVTVYLTGTTTKVPVFSNAEGTDALTNPLTSSANGRVAFYADPAVFDFVIEKGYFRDTITGIQVDTLLASELGVNSGALLVGTDNGENLQERIDGIESDIAALDSDKQPLDATLTALAGVTTEADKLIYAGGEDSFATTAFTSAARDLLDDVDAAAMRVTLGANVDVQVHAAAGKSTPVDADEFGIVDSAASNVLKKLTWANLKATLKTYLDTLYALTGAVTTSGLTMSTARLLGRTTGSSGAVEEITVGSGLSLSGGTLSASGGGSGDVVGPASATADRIAAFDGTTGKLLKDGGAVISTDGTFASNSDAKVPTEKAVKTFVDATVGAGFEQAARVFNVGQAPGMYVSLADAVTAINADPVPPSTTNRVAIKVWPGKYTMTAAVTVPAYVGIVGVSKGLVQFQNDTTDMFVCSGRNWFEDFLIEGSSTSTIYAFDGNNADAIHVRRVDMLNNGGTARQRFLKQSGSAWDILFIEHCIVDYRAVSDYSVFLENTSGAARIVDVNINDVFFDAYGLTGYGGSFLIRNTRDVRFKRSTIRGAATWNTGIRLERTSGVTGTPTCEVRQCDMANLENAAGGVSIFNTANTQVYISNSDCPGSSFSGASTVRNSNVA